MKEEDLTFSFILDEIRCPRFWGWIPGYRSVSSSVTMYQGLYD